MNVIVECPRCGEKILAQTVTCVKCHRGVQAAQCVVAPVGSKYAGQFVCAHCIDGARKKPGPSEMKES